jgi:putative ABC transport system permease protein
MGALTMLREWIRRLWGTLTRRRSDRDLEGELAAHLELAEEDYRRQGHSAREAARLARLRFGGATPAMEDLRAQRGLPWVDGWWLDVKLGLRMLRKSWGLTLVGGLGMAVAISIGVAVFAFSELLLDTTLPIEEGDRVVALQTWDATAQRRLPTRVADFERWREDLRQVVEVSAFETVERNLIVGDTTSGGVAEPVEVARITASGFELARVPPRLGRTLVDADEREGAEPVVVIGHGVWQSRFDSDPEVVGKTLRLGATVHTIVGVMPEGFAFPINHRLWTPLRARSAQELRAPPMGSVFARLAPGATLAGARAELETVGLVLPAAPVEGSPATTGEPARDEQVHPRVVSYTFGFAGDFDSGQVRWVLRVVLLLITLLLVPPCANVAILVYARTVTRQEELATRFALGASRARVVGQLFVELLVLAGVAAALALLATRSLLRFLEAQQAREVPFWLDFGISAETVLFAAGLAVLAAAIASLIPAIQATGRLSRSGLRGPGARASLGLGATWTVLVAGQVAFSLAVLPTAVEMAWGTLRSGALGPGFAAEEYLSARLELDDPSELVPEEAAPVAAASLAAVQDELAHGLEGEPGVSGVAFASAVPGEEPWIRVEIEGRVVPEDGILSGQELVQVGRVGAGYFELFGATPLTGRRFDASDRRPDASAVIVDRTFAEQLLGAGNPLGRRLRYRGSPRDEDSAPPPRWFEIVGIFDDLPANKAHGKVYHPTLPGEAGPAILLLRVGQDPAGHSDRLREIATAVDPTLRLDDVRTLDAVYRQHAVGNNMGAFVLAAVTLSVLLLSAAGIYALMSFTVERRRREIAIRAALGAQPGRLLAAIYRRALRQLGAGAACGVLAAVLLGRLLPIELAGGWKIPGVIPSAALLMVAIGLLAALGPSRRGLRIEPLEELREG